MGKIYTANYRLSYIRIVFQKNSHYFLHPQKNILYEPDLSEARSGTLVYPKTRVTNTEASSTGYPTLYDTDYSISLRDMQTQCHELINI